MFKIIGDFGRYNSTVKTVVDACQQAKNDWHMSDGDLQALEYAIEDLQAILKHYKENI